MTRAWRWSSASAWLAVIVAVGLAVRFWGLTFGLPLTQSRPDELLIINYALAPHRGNSNPKFFDYPTLYLYVLAGLYSLYYGWGLVTGRFQTPADFVGSLSERWEPFFMIGRVTAAIVGTATIAAVFAVARPLFGTVAALSSALFTALAFLHVRDSHYGTTDAPMTFFIMCTMVAVVRVYQHRRASDARLAGFLGGIATGTKYNAVLLAVPMIVMEVLHAWPHRRDWRRVLRETHLVRMGICFAAVFLATSPYLLLDHEFAFEQLRILHDVTAGGMTPPELLGRGWTYHITHSLWYGLGWPLLFAGLGGLVWMLVRRPAEAVVLAAFPLSYYFVAGAGYTVFVRYMMPVVPFLCVFAGYLVAEAAVWIAPRIRRAEVVPAAVLAVVLVAPSAWRVIQFDTLLSREDTRLVAGRWIINHVPPGSTIYMTGNQYGHPQLERLKRGDRPRYRYFHFNYRTEAFTEHGRATTDLPDWIVEQRSEIPYSHIPPKVTQLLQTQYHLVSVVRGTARGQGNFYDIQDAFYVPYGSFRRVVRPGPNLRIYQRRGMPGELPDVPDDGQGGGPGNPAN